MTQRMSNRHANENQSSVAFEPKAGCDKPKVRPPAIKFELQKGKTLRNESPQPEKEVRRELFREETKKSQELKPGVMFQENPRIESPPQRKRITRGGIDRQQKLSYNEWEHGNNGTSSLLRNISQSPDNLSLQQHSDKTRPLSSKSFDASGKSKKVNKWMIDVSRSQNFNDKDEDYFDKINTKSMYPTTNEITARTFKNDAVEKNDIFDDLRLQSKSERARPEEKGDTFKTNIEKATEVNKPKPKTSKVQSSANKLKAQLAFVNVTLVSPKNTMKGNLSVRNINLSTRNNSSTNLRAVRQSSGTLKFKDSFHEGKSSPNASINLRLREKSPEGPNLFVNKSVNLRSSNNMKENRGARLANIQQKQNQQGCEMSRDTGRKMTLREAILNRTRSEKSLHKKKAQELEEKVVRQVFRTLDKYKKGVINADTVDISTIDSKILELISEVLFEMEDNECSLNAEQFHQQLIKKNLIEELMKLVPLPNEDEQVGIVI